MNPMVAQHLKQVKEGVEDLCALLAETSEQIAHQTEAREELRKQHWTQAKEIAILKEGQDELAGLRRENDRLHGQTKEIAERLRRILRCTRALSEEFPP